MLLFVEFLKINYLSKIVIILQENFKINASNLLRIASCFRTNIITIKKNLFVNFYKYIIERFLL